MDRRATDEAATDEADGREHAVRVFGMDGGTVRPQGLWANVSGETGGNSGRTLR